MKRVAPGQAGSQMQVSAWDHENALTQQDMLSMHAHKPVAKTE